MSIHTRLRDTIGYQTNVMRYCPYPAQRKRAVLIIAPLMLIALPFFLLKYAFSGLGIATLAVLHTAKEALVGIPQELHASWVGEDALSVSRWEQYEDFRTERRNREALA